jgi:TatA/E family protein of Tat protein translocase
MFGLEFSHILVLAAIALIVLGPKEMPKLAKIIGRTVGELKKAMRDVTSHMSAQVEDVHQKPEPNKTETKENKT